MAHLWRTFFTLCREHRIAILTALFVGLLYGLPNVAFILSLGGEYQGIPMLATPNEGSYLGLIQEVLDGHPSLGSPFLFEHKDAPPLVPPVGEWFYAFPALLLRIPPAVALMASKFVLPPLLFLLVYALAARLMAGAGESRKITALACGLLVVLGYDLVDYRTVLSYLSGAASPGAFLLWARPVNPILGAIFLFAFLLAVLEIIGGAEKRKVVPLAAASFFLALMFASYFFSWGVALSVLAALIVIFAARREYHTAGFLSLVIPFGALFASPYWFGAWEASRSPLYESVALRSGLFYTNYPLVNKFLLATLAFYLFVLAADYLWRKSKRISFQFEPWHWFSLALLLGGLWAYSQQLVTGRTIWPYHFVQYTIPLAMVVGMALLHNVIREWNRQVWGVFVSLAVFSSVIFGVYTQSSAYSTARPLFAGVQRYAPLFVFLNKQEKDCVVFTNETNPEMSELNTLIPAFTRCNRYATTELNSFIPAERSTHMYLSLLRLRAVSPDEIETYLGARRDEAVGYLFSNWKGLFGVKHFPDFSDPVLEERLREFPRAYRDFVAKNFKDELTKHRLDYILSDGELPKDAARQIEGVAQVFENGGKVLYSVPSD